MMARMEFSTPVFLVTCAECGVRFDRGYRLSKTRAANPQYCTPACRRSAIKMTPAEALNSLKSRFEVLVIRRGPKECWGWSGRKNGSGYCLIDHAGRPQLAHRMSYLLHTGTAPSELIVCHSCDNPECTNPSHLWLGSHQDNMTDASVKGRMSGGPRGSQVNTSKLSEADVLHIYSSSEPGPQIAAKYGITKEAVYAIRSRKNWGWLHG